MGLSSTLRATFGPLFGLLALRGDLARREAASALDADRREPKLVSERHRSTERTAIWVRTTAVRDSYEVRVAELVDEGTRRPAVVRAPLAILAEA